MSSASEFDVNLKLLNEILVQFKPNYNNLINKEIRDTMVELQALAIYIEKGSGNIPPKDDDDFDNQVWKVLQEIENEGTATDIAQSQFNKLFTKHQTNLLKLANINRHN
jgi:hypothetical protein